MTAKINSYRELKVWQKAMEMVNQVYGITRQFPSEEMYGLTSQIRRSAVSVPSNIAEGYGRNSTIDYVRFLRMASGSLYEMQTQLEIAVGLKYIANEKFETINHLSLDVAKMLSSMINRLFIPRAG